MFTCRMGLDFRLVPEAYSHRPWGSQLPLRGPKAPNVPLLVPIPCSNYILLFSIFSTLCHLRPSELTSLPSLASS